MKNAIAQTILNQLGGNRFIAMTGAKNFVGSDSALMFSLSSRDTKNKSNKVRITLTNMDDYTVEFFNIRGVKVKEVSKHEGVYFDVLQEVFTRQTGLYTSL